MNKEATPAGALARGSGAGGGSARQRRPKGRKEDWIGDQLRQVYDEALQEAIPDDMLALLNQLDGEKDEGGGS